nr:MAG TPA: hypothetical protein [Bacteriophage sp.]
MPHKLWRTGYPKDRFYRREYQYRASTLSSERFR